MPLRLVREGLVDGLRIDHPDGLADPRGYLRRLATATGGAWVVAEKILAGDEELPPTGRAPAPPATTRSAWSAACSLDPAGREAADRGLHPPHRRAADFADGRGRGAKR